MTVRSHDSEFSHRLTESILSHTPNSTISSKAGHSHSTGSTRAQHPAINTASLTKQTTPRLVTTLPASSIVIQPRDSDSSFNNYIGNHFKEDAPVLLDRINVASPLAPPHVTNPAANKAESTFWAYLSNDLDGRPPPPSISNSIKYYNRGGNEKDSTWHEYESIFAGQTSEYSDATHFFSAGAFLFLFGFICPPLWWIGSFFPMRIEDGYRKKYDSDIKMLKRWRSLNRFFSLGFSTLLIIAIIVLAVLYSKTS